MEVNRLGPIRKLWLPHKLRQVGARADSEPNLLGFSDQHCDNGDQIAEGESQSSNSRGSEPPTTPSGFSKITGTPDRSVLFNSPGDPSSSSPLQRPSESETSGSQEGWIQCNSPSIRGGKGGSRLVDRTLTISKRSTYGERPTIPADRDGCFTNGLGSCVRRRENWRSVDGREVTPHQLSGAAGCLTRSSCLCKGQARPNNPDIHGQHKSSGIYKSCLLYTSPSPRDATLSRMPSSA